MSSKNCYHSLCGHCGGIQSPNILAGINDICSPKCINANLDVCECKCQGKHHKGRGLKDSTITRILNPKKKSKLNDLPVGFKGSYFGKDFFLIHQLDFSGEVTIEAYDSKNSELIFRMDKRSKIKVVENVLANWIFENNPKLVTYQERDLKDVRKVVRPFIQNLRTEILIYNKKAEDFFIENKNTKFLPAVIPKNLPAVIPKAKAKPSTKKAKAKPQPKQKEASAVNPAKGRKTHDKGYQYGSSNQERDKYYQAKPSGKRTSKNGNVYYEYRANRSDTGKLLGVTKAFIKTTSNGYTFLNFFNSKEIYDSQGFDTLKKAQNYAKKYSVELFDKLPNNIDSTNYFYNK